MKITRKLAAIGLALILLLVCSVSAFADEPDNSAPTGGAINYPANPLDTNIIFNSNNAPSGGAINYPTNPLDANINFNSNNAPNGGAINVPTNPLDSNINFNSNNAPNGGAIYYLQE